MANQIEHTGHPEVKAVTHFEQSHQRYLDCGKQSEPLYAKSEF